MILVDTSVWVDHLRGGDARLAAELRDRLKEISPESGFVPQRKKRKKKRPARGRRR